MPGPKAAKIPKHEQQKPEGAIKPKTLKETNYEEE